MANKTIYVSDEDLWVYERAQELAGGSLSKAILTALRRYIDVEDGRSEGFEEIVVRVGPRAGTQQRFVGVLLGEWSRSNPSGAIETFRVFRSRRGKFVVHTARSKGWTSGSPDDAWSKGWRSWIGNWSGSEGWGVIPAHATLQTADTVEDLKPLLPKELYGMVLDLAQQPDIEDLDI